MSVTKQDIKNKNHLEITNKKLCTDHLPLGWKPIMFRGVIFSVLYFSFVAFESPESLAEAIFCTCSYAISCGKHVAWNTN